jgi:hypothetical protein
MTASGKIKMTPSQHAAHGRSLWIGGTQVVLRALYPKTVLLASITTYGTRGIGQASQALRRVTERADKFGVEIVLSVIPQDGGSLDADSLQAWYGRHGFVEDAPGSATMTRYPTGNRPESV